MGVGVAIDARHVLTAHYLLLGANQVELSLADGRARKVKRTRVHHETGLGIAELAGPELHPVAIASGPPAAPGQPVFLLTCSEPNERKLATGHVSRVGPFEAFWEYMLDRAIMTTIVNPGLSGAPLCDLEGRLLGIVSLGIAAVGRYSLAIPIDLFTTHRAELLGESERRGPARAWVGFYPHAHDGGVVVSGVIPNGPAARAGLAGGDVLLSVDGHGVQTLRELYRAIWKKQPGDALGFGVLREATAHVIEVTAGDRDAFYR
jgi:S1-C subfamily serine protease